MECFCCLQAKTASDELQLRPADLSALSALLEALPVLAQTVGRERIARPKAAYPAESLISPDRCQGL